MPASPDPNTPPLPVPQAAPPPLLRAKAWTCAALNLLAFPGVGTVMARKPGGYWQMCLSLVGFCLFTVFLIQVCYALVHQMLQGGERFLLSAELKRFAWTGLTGAILCIVSWVWALLSSIQILRESR